MDCESSESLINGGDLAGKIMLIRAMNLFTIVIHTFAHCPDLSCEKKVTTIPYNEFLRNQNTFFCTNLITFKEIFVDFMTQSMNGQPV